MADDKLTARAAERIDSMGITAPHSWRQTLEMQARFAIVVLDRHAQAALDAAAAKRARRARRGR